MLFYRDGLTTSFRKILTDDAVNSWKFNIQFCILTTCGKLLHLCALHIKLDNPELLDLLAVVLDPDNKFHIHNASKHSEMHLQSDMVAEVGVVNNSVQPHWGSLQENQIFARSPSEPRSARGWLVDLINRFGQFGGFDGFLERFNAGIALINKKQISNDLNNTNTIGNPENHHPISSSGTSTLSLSEDSSSKMKTSTISSSGTNSTTTSMLSDDNNKLTLPLIYALIRPFGQCYELLTVETIERYFMPIWDVVLELLESLSDDELKREARLESKNDTINGIVKAARYLIRRLPNQENLIKDLEMCRLKIILRVLQISSFNGKMNALNEINKVLSFVSYPHPHRPQTPEDDVDFLTAERMAVSYLNV